MVDKRGYKLESTGRIIPHYGINLAELEPEEFKELKETSVNMISQMQIKDKIHVVEEKIDILTNKVDKAITVGTKIQGDAKMHLENCPINESRIEQLFNAWYGGIISEYNDIESARGKRFTAKVILDVKGWIKNTILTTGNISGAIITFLILMAAFGAVVYVASSAAN